MNYMKVAAAFRPRALVPLTLSFSTCRYCSNSRFPLSVKKIHHAGIMCSDSIQTGYWLAAVYGFECKGYYGLEHGSSEICEILMKKNDIQFVLTSTYSKNNYVADIVRDSGFSIVNVAFLTDDADATYCEALRRGAIPSNCFLKNAIKVYNKSTHSFVTEEFLNYFDDNHSVCSSINKVIMNDSGLCNIDHVVANVPMGEMQVWKQFYESVFGFSQFVSFDDKQIKTENSALKSIVMANDDRSIKLPVNEPALHRKKSQIQEYLDFNLGAGIQHIALETRDIVGTVRNLRSNGCEFLSIVPEYYDNLEAHAGPFDENVSDLRELQILLDRDNDGYMLQIFTAPCGIRPTLFFEIIQRKKAQSFGAGNFKTLFMSIEMAQKKRGTLSNN